MRSQVIIALRSVKQLAQRNGVPKLVSSSQCLLTTSMSGFATQSFHGVLLTLFSYYTVHVIQLSCTLFVKGLTQMSRGCKVSFANTISFINMSTFFQWKNIYVMTISVAHWNTLDDSLALKYAREDIFEFSNGKCHFCKLYSACRP